jgi:hypothetical protein
MFRIFTLIFALISSQAHAQFQLSESDKLYVDYTELSLNYEPGAEFTVYAIVSSYPEHAVYVITRFFRGRVLPFGTFECSVEFTYLSSSTNGFRDIRCITSDGVGNQSTSILRVANNAGYEATRP